MWPLSNPLAGLSAEVARIPETASLAAVKVVKEIAKREAQKVAGADRRLSNLGRRGGLTTRDTFKAGTASTQVTVFAVPPAPWRWMTDGTSAHIIGGGRANRRTGNYSGRKVTSRKRLRIGGGWVDRPRLPSRHHRPQGRLDQRPP